MEHQTKRNQVVSLFLRWVDSFLLKYTYEEIGCFTSQYTNLSNQSIMLYKYDWLF